MKVKPIPLEINLLLRIVDEGYDRKAWHGPNLRGSIRGLDIHEVSWRPAIGRHNIWEIVIHAAYWKYIVRRRLLGERKGSFSLPGSNWFARPTTMTPEAWRIDLALLEAMHRKLRAAIVGLTSRDLNKTPHGSKVSNAAIISGIAAHDVYHAGQIQLLKRLYRSQAGEGQALFPTRRQRPSPTMVRSAR
ncbi:MAG TPA: DinB family protein [archaeon]|nr:DinB family protein [archaeon]